mgnify:CR=1 FL=1
MSKAKKASAPIGAKTSWKNAFKRDWQLYLMLLFPLAMVIIFNYASYPGLRMIFMDYKPAKGYSGSEWVGMKTILKVFKDADFHRALKSSIAFNLLDLVVGFPMPIILALMLNELRYPRFKKVTQTILYLPHFLSWVIVGSVAYTMFRPTTGLVNIALMNWGVISEGIPFLTEKWHWAVTYLLIGVWQGMGWGTILYLAAIAGISPDLYEAAEIDGANHFQRVWNITIPCILPTITTLLILDIGGLVGSGGAFEKVFLLYNPMTYEKADIISTYVYRMGIGSGNYSYATAVGLFEGLINLVLLTLANIVSKKTTESGLF